jgi:plastocyanin
MTAQRTGLLVAAIIAVVAVVLLALPQGPPPAGFPDADGNLEVELAIRSFEPAEVVLPTGRPLTITFVNNSDVDHTIAFGRGTVEDGQHPFAPELDMLRDLDVRATPPLALIRPTASQPFTGIRIPLDESVTVSFTLPDDRAGAWELGCFTSRGCYFELGFRADVTVE